MSSLIPTGASGSRRRRRGLLSALAVLCVSAALAVALAGRYWPPAPPAPPAVDARGVDPAVVAALDEARGAVGRSPRSADAWGRLGMVLLANDFGPQAGACFAEAERLDPHEARWPYLYGLWLHLSDPAAALRKLKRGAELSNRATQRVRYAEVLLEQGRMDEAEEGFRTALRLDPGNPRAHLGLAQVLGGRDDWAGAREELRLSVQSDFTRKASLALLSQADRRLGDPAAAADDAKQAEGAPDDTGWPDPFVEEVRGFQVGKKADLARGGNLLKSGRADQAAVVFQKVVVDYPDSERGWLMLGRARLARREWKGADEALEKAVRLAPGLAEGHFYLGAFAFEQGDHRTAATHFKEAVRLNPEYALAHYNLGHCLKREDDAAGALAEFRDAARCQPHFEEALVNAGELLAARGENAEALIPLRQAVELNPDDAQAQHLLNEVLARVGAPQGPRP